MSHSSRRRPAALSRGLLLPTLSLLALPACQRAPAAAAASSKPPSESVLGQVTLSPQAETRLGIAAGLSPLALHSGAARRLLRGEVIAAPGKSAWVFAPHAGTVQPLPAAPPPLAGTRVQAGQVLAGFTALLGPTERAQVSTVRVDADAQLARAQVQDQAADLALRRAERLLAEEAIGQKVLDDAKAQREIAAAALQAALTQRAALVGGTGAGSPATARAALQQTLLVSPLPGRLREVRATPSAQVLAGTPLFEVIADDPLWVRVPIPAAEIAALDPESGALVDELSAPAGTGSPATPIAARPASSAPSTAQPLQATVDRYFVLPAGAQPAIGQVVAVWVSLRGETTLPVLPAPALLHDPSGGTWVYERTAEHVFSRRRVEVVRVEGALALLSPQSLRPGGLRVGSAIVTAGAMELYGAEFGSGK
jgi:multidrug efflux pump subunit AcrA (membrane-fusion protein)